MRSSQFATAIFLSVLTFGVAAQDDDHDDDDGNYAIGLMLASDQSIYVGGDDEVQPFPYIQASWGDLYFEGGSVGYYLFENDNWTIKTSLSLEGLGDDNRDDSVILADMGDFDQVFLGQVELEYEAEWGELGLTLGADASGTYDGYVAEIEYGYPMELGSWRIEPSIGVEWVSEEVNQYYYGVEQKHVRAGRGLYLPGAGVNYSAGITAMYPFMQHHAIVIQAEYEVLSKEVSDSPIVDRDNTMTIGLGYVYRF